METREKADVLVKLYDRQMTHYEKTQDVEWKGSFGLWTVLAVGIGWAAGHSFRLPLIIGVALALVATVVHIGWLRAVHVSEEFDKRLWVHYRREANALIATTPPDEEPADAVRLWWLVLEMLPTLGLALILAWLAHL